MTDNPNRDRVAVPSIRKDGTPNQTPDFEIIIDQQPTPPEQPAGKTSGKRGR